TMAYKIKILLIALIVPVALFSQTQQFSLQQALDYGINNNPLVKSAGLDVQNAHVTVNNRISSGLPQVDISVDYQNFFQLPTSLIPAEFFPDGEPGEFIPVQFGTEQNLTAGISASQLIFNGAWFVGISAAKEYVSLVTSQKELTENEVKKNVEFAYYSVLVGKEFEKLLQKNITNLSKVQFEISEMHKQGFVEQIDVDRLTISKTTLDGQLQNAKRQTVLATNLLKYSIGLDMNTAIELTDSLNMMNRNVALNPSDQNYLTRPEFNILNKTITLNEFNVRLNKAMYLPTLALYATYSENAQRNSFNFFDGSEPWFETGLVGVKMQIPVFSGFQRKTTLQAAQIGLEKAQLDLTNATQGIMLEIETAKTNYLNAQTDLETQNKNIELAQKIYDTALIKYREGVGSSIELNNAESTLYMAQGNYINALFNLLNAQINLNKSLGYY
ncbi:MAG: TolC family protein, partial [Chitinophagales bacterium]